MTVHHLRTANPAPRQPDEPTPAERFDYLDSLPIQLGVGAIAITWAIGFCAVTFAYACAAYGVDAVLRAMQRGQR